MAAAAAASEDQAEEEEADLGAIGFMFSNETSKAWVTHQLAPGVVVDVLCIDEDGPGALQSGESRAHAATIAFVGPGCVLSLIHI